MTDVAPDPLLGFVESVQARANAYLSVRPDQYEQLDHLRHVSNRAHWLFYNELVRATPPGAPVMMSRRDSLLLDACTFSHDLGKWIPRDDLAALLPKAVTPAQAEAVFRERARGLLGLSEFQLDLLWLGLRRRLDPAVDAYSAVYDAAHHLVSAYIVTGDPALGFNALSRDDQGEVLTTVIGHQFGAYYKRTLFELGEAAAERRAFAEALAQLEGEAVAAIFRPLLDDRFVKAIAHDYVARHPHLRQPGGAAPKAAAAAPLPPPAEAPAGSCPAATPRRSRTRCSSPARNSSTSPAKANSPAS